MDYFIHCIYDEKGQCIDSKETFADKIKFLTKLHRLIEDHNYGVVSYCEPPEFINRNRKLIYERPFPTVYPRVCDNGEGIGLVLDEQISDEPMKLVNQILDTYNKKTYKTESFYDFRTNSLFDRYGNVQYRFGIMNDDVLDQRKTILYDFLDVAYNESYARLNFGFGYELVKDSQKNDADTEQIIEDENLLKNALYEIINLIRVHFTITDIAHIKSAFAQFSEKEHKEYEQRCKNIKSKLLALSIRFNDKAPRSLGLIKKLATHLFRINELFPYTF